MVSQGPGSSLGPTGPAKGHPWGLGSSSVATVIVNLVHSYAKQLVINLGFAVQGNNSEELPEQMIGAVQIMGIDLTSCPTLVATSDTKPIATAFIS